MSLHKYTPHPHLAHRKKHGPVRVADVRGTGNGVARFNTRAAVLVTRAVGTMWCAYAFCVLALYGLPAGLRGGAAGFVQWASSQFIQLVLLPIIIVGSAVLAEVSDRLAKRQFDDVEAILHAQDQVAQHLAAQDEKILAILERIEQSGDQIAALAEAVREVMAARVEHESGVAADAKAARTAAESAFVATRALAAKAMEKPGPGELAAAVRENTEAVRQVHQAVTAPEASPDPGPAAAKPASSDGGKM